MNNSIIKFIDLLTDSELETKDGEIYILTIAIDNYETERELNFCKRDSEYLLDIIIKKSFTKIKEKNVYKLYDREATKLQIFENFKTLKKILNPSDQLIIHFAGHSEINLNTNFLVPCDGDRKDVFSNISSLILREFISSINHTSCILILNSYDSNHNYKTKELTENNENFYNIMKSKYFIFSELIGFLEHSEENVSKSIWHFTNSHRSTNRSSEKIIVVEDKRAINAFVKETENNIKKLIDGGNFEKALEQIILISKNNSPKLRDQADALLFYLKEKSISRHLINAISPVEAKEITLDLVHQVHECGYYLVPSPNVIQTAISKSKPKKILYASADTLDQDRLRLDEEYRAINLELLRSSNRDEFELVACLSSRIADLQRELLNNNPYIVHFTGHGTCKGILMVSDESGDSSLVKNEPLGNLFGLFAKDIKCVFLNSCYSASQSGAISVYIDNVVCMSSAILDNTAIKFASAFYMSLGSGRDISFSFEFAKNSIDLHNCADKDLPLLITKKTA